jgi:hypothetical protein
METQWPAGLRSRSSQFDHKGALLSSGGFLAQNLSNCCAPAVKSVCSFLLEPLKK